MTVDRETFLKARLPERDVDLPGVGTVRVRGLSRAEAMRVRDLRDDLAAAEQLLVTLGLVDPALSAGDVAAWYEAAPAGEIDRLVGPIQELSALGEDAPKSGLPGLRP